MKKYPQKLLKFLFQFSNYNFLKKVFLTKHRVKFCLTPYSKNIQVKLERNTSKD